MLYSHWVLNGSSGTVITVVVYHDGVNVDEPSCMVGSPEKMQIMGLDETKDFLISLCFEGGIKQGDSFTLDGVIIDGAGSAVIHGTADLDAERVLFTESYICSMHTCGKCEGE